MIYKINTIETWHQQKDKTKPHGLTSSFKKLLYTVKGQKSCCVDIFPYITLYVFISLFVFVSAAGHYFVIWTGSIWTGQGPALF